MPEGFDLLPEHVALQVRNSVWPRHVALCKGKAWKKNPEDFPLKAPDGSIDISALVTFSGSDFISQVAGNSWTLEPDFAET